MAAIGVNVSADGRHDGAFVRSLGATWVRIVLTHGHDLRGRLADYRSHGVRVLGVYANESRAGFGNDAEALDGYARIYGGLLSALQVGNEPDLVSPSSWTLSRDDLTALGHLARVYFPGHYLVYGGLASGQPGWLVGADLSWCDAIACHPYLRDGPNPDDLEDLPDVDLLVTEYRALGLPVWVTEWGWWGYDEQRGAEEADDMLGWAANTLDVPVFFWFCADDAMVPPFGLLRADGSPKPALTVFRHHAAHAVEVPLVQPAPSPEPATEPGEEVPIMDPLTEAWRLLWQAHAPVPYFPEWGIPSYWREHFQDLGSPLASEIDEGNGRTLQVFARGIVRWRPDAGVERVA